MVSAFIESGRFLVSRLKLRKFLADKKTIFFHDHRGLTTYSREEYLVDVSRGKHVLHFGFLDHPFSEENIRSQRLLHLKIQKAAISLFGVDINNESLYAYRRLTGDNANFIFDVQEKGCDLAPLVRGFDCILFPEILEHLKNPGEALRNLRSLCIQNGGASFYVTVPNAFFVGGFIAAARGSEIVHPDHYYYFSPTTLEKLLRDSGFSKVEISLYRSAKNQGWPGIAQNGVIAKCTP